jgi:hypothetical protein
MRRELFAACQRRFLDDHPAPDFSTALALSDPQARVAGALVALYRSYRERESMTSNVLRDRPLVPELVVAAAAKSGRGDPPGEGGHLGPDVGETREESRPPTGVRPPSQVGAICTKALCLDCR